MPGDKIVKNPDDTILEKVGLLAKLEDPEFMGNIGDKVFKPYREKGEDLAVLAAIDIMKANLSLDGTVKEMLKDYKGAELERLVYGYAIYVVDHINRDQKKTYRGGVKA